MRHLTNITVSFITLFIGCNQAEKQVVKKDKQAAYKKANGIREETIYKLRFDSSGNKLFQRVEWIHSYDDNGLLLQSVEPRYESLILEPYKNSSKPKFSDIRDFLPPISENTETDIPKGFSDTTIFQYDEKGQLTKELRKWHERDGNLLPEINITFEYDKFGNKTKSCTLRKTNENKCFFTSFVYDESGRIKYRYDSSSYENYSLIWKGKSDDYQYDKKGNILYDGYKKYKYDINDNVIETIGVKPGFDSELLKYNEKGLVSQVTIIANNDTLRTNYFQYDERGLILENKEKVQRKIKNVFKYEYK